jgi:hypothetical protein
MPWLLILPLSFLAVLLMLFVIPGSAVAQAATGVAAFAGTLPGPGKPSEPALSPSPGNWRSPHGQ